MTFLQTPTTLKPLNTGYLRPGNGGVPPGPLVEIRTTQKIPAGSANQLAPAILQPRAASRTKTRVMLQRERALHRSRFTRNISRGCLHQEILTHRVNFQLPLAPP